VFEKFIAGAAGDGEAPVGLSFVKEIADLHRGRAAEPARRRCGGLSLPRGELARRAGRATPSWVRSRAAAWYACWAPAGEGCGRRARRGSLRRRRLGTARCGDPPRIQRHGDGGGDAARRP
jgi:hypothetical protein